MNIDQACRVCQGPSRLSDRMQVRGATRDKPFSRLLFWGFFGRLFARRQDHFAVMQRQ